MINNWGTKAGKFVKDVADKAAQAADVAKKNIDDSGVLEKAGAAVSKTKQILDEKGVTDQVNKAAGVVGDHFDTVAGVKLLRLVEERLELQAQYNDILAEKLEEALKRIETLEAELAQSRRGA